jgi:hypothetical protein
MADRNSPRSWRALVRIEAVDKDSGLVQAVVPQWDPTASILLPVSAMPSELAKTLKPGQRLIAYVNIGVEKEEDLRFSNFRAAPTPDPDDGLGEFLDKTDRKYGGMLKRFADDHGGK